MTLRTGLVISGDARGAVDALESADRAMAGAQDEAAALAAAYQRADASIGQLAKAQAEATREIAAAKAAFNAGETSLEEYNRSLLETKAALSLVQAEQRESVAAWRNATTAYNEAVERGMKPANDNLGKVGKSSQLAGFHVQNLAFQFQDIAVQAQAGVNPMTIFVQQGAQVAGIMAQAQIGVFGLVKQLTAMTAGFLVSNPLLLAAAAAAGVLAVGVGLVTDEINKTSDVTVTWQDVLLGTFDVVSEAVQSQVAAGFEAMGVDVGEVWDTVVEYTKTAINIIIGANLVVPRTIAATYDKIGPAIGDAFYSGVNLAIDALNGLLVRAAAPLNGLIGAFNTAFGTSIPAIVLDGVDRIANPYAGAMRKLGSAGASAVVSAFTTDYIGDFASAVGDAAENRALQRQAKEAGDKVGGAIGRATGQAAAETFPKAFLDAVNDNAKLAADNAEAIARAFGESSKAIRAEEDARESLRGDYQALIREMEIEQNLIGATAEERAIAAVYLEREGFMARYAALGIEEATRMWEKYRDISIAIIKGKSAADEEAQRIQRLAGQLEGLAGLVPGRAGQALSSILNLDIGLEDGTTEKLSQTLANAFDDGGGTLSKAIGAAFQGAQIGSAVDGLFDAIGIKSSNTGAQLGGAVGGAFFGPLGAIGGSILGGIVGGLLKGTPRASATIEVIAGDAMQTAVRGNSSKLKGIANGLADGLINSLGSIADALGGELGNFGGISIGVRNGTFRVDPTGQGRTKNLPKFETEEAAIYEALRIAISRGAIGGVRAGTDTLLRGFGDLEAQLEKASLFEGFFDRFEQATEPLNYELRQLEEEFDVLRGIFAEARATTEEYAQLEQLYQIERTKLIEEFGAAVSETGEVIGAANEQLRERTDLTIRLLEVQGREEEALALRRDQLREATAEANRDALEEVFAAEDAARAQAELARAQEEAARTAEEAARIEEAVARERTDLTIRLLEAQGREEEALALRRDQLREATAEANRAYLEEVFAAEDAARAQAELARAQEEAARTAEEAARIEAAIARERTDLSIQLLEAQGREEEALALRRDQLREATAEANRAYLEEVFAAEDAARAQAELARAQEEAARTAEEAARIQEAIARERTDLSIQLLEAQGRAEEALALRRDQLREATAEANRDLLEQVFAAEDAARTQAEATRLAEESARAAADAQADLARAQDEAARSAQEAARTQAAIAREASDLTIQLLEAQGRAEEALALRRDQLREATAEANRDLLEEVFAAEDAARAREEAERQAEAAARAAAEAAAEADRQAQAAARAAAEQATAEARAQEEAARAAADAQAELARAQEEAARAAEALRKAGVGLEIRYLELLGDSAAATALRRQEERAATDASLQGWLDLIYELEDAKVAQEAYEDAITSHSEAVAAARDTLSEAYEREASAITETRDRFRALGQELRAYQAELGGAALAGAASYRAAQVQFMTTSALAATGDAEALGGLRGASSAFLEASRARAGSLQEFQRDLAAVARAVSEGITATDEAVDYAELQLEALDRSVEGLIEINESVISVEEAITRLQQLISNGPGLSPATGTAPAIPTAAATSAPAAPAPLDRNSESLLAEIAQMLRKQTESGDRSTRSLDNLWKFFERYEDPDGLRVVQVEPA